MKHEMVKLVVLSAFFLQGPSPSGWKQTSTPNLRRAPQTLCPNPLHRHRAPLYGDRLCQNSG